MIRVVVVAAGYNASNRPLQPWRYLYEMVEGLRRQGAEVFVITNIISEATDQVIYRKSLYSTDLVSILRDLNPEICLWHFGLTSTLRKGSLAKGMRHFAIFTSPIYSKHQLLRLGFHKLWKIREYSLIHLIGAFIPRGLLCRSLNMFEGVVVESVHNFTELRQLGLSHLHHIPPGISAEERSDGASVGDGCTVLYLGSPLAVRGILDLIDACAMAIHHVPELRLRILARARGNQYDAHLIHVKEKVDRYNLQAHIDIESGFLDRTEILDYFKSSVLIALPFQIVPSDVPLAILEAMAAGKAVVGTDVDGIPEYLKDGCGYITRAGDSKALAAVLVKALTHPLELKSTAERAWLTAKTFPEWSESSKKLFEILTSAFPSLYLTGADGVGKTTQMDRLMDRMPERERIWLRFPAIFSIPLLIYARLRGYTRYTMRDGQRYGEWHFEKSLLLRSLFPIAQYVDLLILSYRVRSRYCPVLYERFALDVLVDLMAALRKSEYHKSYLGKRFLSLIPKNTKVIILSAPYDTIRERRPDLLYDPMLKIRIDIYERIARDEGYEIIDATKSPDEIARLIDRSIE